MSLLALALALAAASTPLPLPPAVGSAPRAQAFPRAAHAREAKVFLVAWQEWSARGTIVGARVDESGKVLDPHGIVLDPDVYKMDTGVRVAACGDVFVLVWNHHEGVPVLRARRVDAKGRVLDEKPLRVSPPGEDARMPAVACSGDTAMFTWLVYGKNDIEARALDVKSGVLGAPGVLEKGRPDRWPTSQALIHDGGAFRAVWGTHNHIEAKLHTARFVSPRDAEGQVVLTYATSSFQLFPVALPEHAGHPSWGVVYRRREQQGGERWMFTRFSPAQKDGAPLDVPLKIDDIGVHDVVARGAEVLVSAAAYTGERPGPLLVRVRADQGDVDGATRGAPLFSLPSLDNLLSPGCPGCTVQWRVSGAALAGAGDKTLAVWTDPVPIEGNPMGARPAQPVDVDVRGAFLDSAKLTLERPEAKPLRVSTGDVLRRFPQAALRGDRAVVTYVEGEGGEVKATVFDTRTRQRRGTASLGLLARECYSVSAGPRGYVVAVAEAQKIRLHAIDVEGRVVGQPALHPAARDFALAFDGTTVWLATTEDKTITAVRLDDTLKPTGEPVLFRVDVRADRVALQCIAPGSCALAWHDEMYGGIHVVGVPAASPSSRPPEVARGGGPSLVAWKDGYALGYVAHEEREARVLRLGRDLKVKGAECPSCGVEQGAMDGPGVPAPTPGGALVDVWKDGFRFLHAKEGWLGAIGAGERRGKGARPFVTVDGNRRVEVWEAGDGVAAQLVD